MASDGSATFTRTFPPEETVESAAARLRPLILQKEPVHYSKVLTALKYFLRNRELPQVDHLVEVLEKAWKEGKESTETRAYRIESDDGTDSISDVKLGYAWIYGDVVHADPMRIAETEEHGVYERFMAAVPLVAHLMMTALATLNLITDLAGKGFFKLPGNPYTTRVHVPTTEVTYPVQVHISATDPNLVSIDDADQKWECMTYETVRATIGMAQPNEVSAAGEEDSFGQGCKSTDL
jgi:hypothetical protein